MKTRHWKSYNGKHSVALMCGDKVVMTSSWKEANFEISGCPDCGMEVKTTGDCPETDSIFEDIFEE